MVMMVKKLKKEKENKFRVLRREVLLILVLVDFSLILKNRGKLEEVIKYKNLQSNILLKN